MEINIDVYYKIVLAKIEEFLKKISTYIYLYEYIHIYIHIYIYIYTYAYIHPVYTHKRFV